MLYTHNFKCSVNIHKQIDTEQITSMDHCCHCIQWISEGWLTTSPVKGHPSAHQSEPTHQTFDTDRDANMLNYWWFAAMTKTTLISFVDATVKQTNKQTKNNSKWDMAEWITKLIVKRVEVFSSKYSRYKANSKHNHLCSSQSRRH